MDIPEVTGNMASSEQGLKFSFKGKNLLFLVN